MGATIILNTPNELKRLQAMIILNKYFEGKESYKNTQKQMLINDTPVYAINKGRGKLVAMFKVGGVNVIERF